MRTHHWSSPRSKLAYKKPTSTRKLRKFPVTSGQGSKHRDWTASRWWARWRSQSSPCQHHVITSRGLIQADHKDLDSVAWPCHDCEVAPVWHHDVTIARTCQFSAVCLTVFLFEFRPRTFTIGFYGKKLYHIRTDDFEVQFSFNTRGETGKDCMLFTSRQCKNLRHRTPNPLQGKHHTSHCNTCRKTKQKSLRFRSKTSGPLKKSLVWTNAEVSSMKFWSNFCFKVFLGKSDKTWKLSWNHLPRTHLLVSVSAVRNVFPKQECFQRNVQSWSIPFTSDFFDLL